MSTPQRQEAYRPTRRELANAIRVLSMDAVEQAKSGHPGAPRGMADIAEVLLWNDYLRHNPANPRWPDRDRFVMSNGHGSMLLYSLHLTGYPLSLDDRVEDIVRTCARGWRNDYTGTYQPPT